MLNYIMLGCKFNLSLYSMTSWRINIGCITTGSKPYWKLVLKAQQIRWPEKLTLSNIEYLIRINLLLDYLTLNIPPPSRTFIGGWGGGRRLTPTPIISAPIRARGQNKFCACPLFDDEFPTIKWVKVNFRFLHPFI